jgi:transcriptional regulator with XRE-family HTH domain
MKQPELGKKISELRKARGLTQEELVEKCNIGVRTIQRIEAGEVTPRSYTIKTILAALESDLKLVSEEDDKSDTFTKRLKRLFLIDVDLDEPSEFFVKQLNIAWIVGLVYFILGIFESVSDYFMYAKGLEIFNNTVFVILKLAALFSFLYFQRGFVLIGGLYKNYLLKITSYLLIVATALIIGYEIASTFYNSVEKEYVMGGAALTFGSICVVHGIALTRLKNLVGRIANYAGVFEIISGCFLITVVLSFVGFLILLPVELFQIFTLYKVVELIQTKQKESIIA